MTGSDAPSKQSDTSPCASAAVRTRDRIYVAILILLPLLIWLPRIEGPIDLRWDAAVYYVTGSSIAAGKGYRLLNEPGEIRAVQYPPLVPAIIALHQKALGTVDAFEVGRRLKVTWIVMLGACSILAYWVARTFVPPAVALLAIALCLLHPDFYINGSYASSELPFALASTLFLFAHYRLTGAKRTFLTTAAAAFAFFARTAGLALLGAWIGEALVRKQFPALFWRIGVTAACVVSWTAYISSVERSAEYQRPAYAYQRAGYLFYNVSYNRNLTYIDPFRPHLGLVSASVLADRALRSLPGLPERFGVAVTTKEGHWALVRQIVNSRIGSDVFTPQRLSFLLACIGLLTAGGFTLLVCRGDLLIGLYVLAAVALASIAPWPSQFYRYISPILPLFTLALCYVLHVTTNRLPKAPALLVRPFAAMVVGSILVVQIASVLIAHSYRFVPGTLLQPGGGSTDYRHIWYGAPDIALDKALEWIAANSNTGDVVAAAMPQWAYLRTARKSVMPPFEAPEVAQRLLDSIPVSYLVYEDPAEHVNPSAPYTQALLATFSDRWRLVFSDPSNYVRVYSRAAAGLAERGDMHRGD